MVLLENKIINIIESTFQAKVTSLRFKQESHYVSHAGHVPANLYSVEIELTESNHKMINNEQPQLTISTIVQSDFFNDNAHGKLMSINRTVTPNGLVTCLSFTTHNIQGFFNSLEDIAWNAYSAQFDSTIQDTLLED